MPVPVFVDKLNDQIGSEFAASQQYAAIAVHYERQTLPQLAAFFHRQSLEERNHAMMMVQYLIDAGSEPVIPGVAAPHGPFEGVVDPVQLALDQERTVSEQITALARLARDEGDYTSEQFMQWFIKEQVEEVASMSDLLTIVTRAQDDPMRAEEYLAREKNGGVAGPDPTAPEAAGGAL